MSSSQQISLSGSEGSSSASSQYRRHVMPYAVEAQWKLAKWDELHLLYTKVDPHAKSTDNLLKVAPVGQGYLLDSLISLDDTRSVLERLKIVRNALMKPLSIAMLDKSAYFRGYDNMLILHSVFDYCGLLRVVNAQDIHNYAMLTKQQPTQPKLDMNNPWVVRVDENNVDIVRKVAGEKLHQLFDLWALRSRLVQPTLRSLEPITAWQRSCCLALARKYPVLQDKINIHVGKLWLKSADSAREARSFDRSFYSLTQARRWFGTEFDKLDLRLRLGYHMEQAKLDWDQGEQTKAIKGLRLSIERLKDHKLSKHLKQWTTKASRNKDPFPELDKLKPCEECNSIDLSDRESFAEIKMLLTHYCEAAAACIPETLFFMYEECVHLGVNQEETYFRLARYYDKLLAYYVENPHLCGEQIEERQTLMDTTTQNRPSQTLIAGDKDRVYAKLMQHSIIAFGNSLKHGVRYIRESMPRMLNIWYNLGSKKPTATCRELTDIIKKSVDFIDDLKNKGVPAYYFMTAISILLSRVTHQNPRVSNMTREIIKLLLVKYPHQIVWLLMPVLHDIENDGRRAAARKILAESKENNLVVDKIIRDTLGFSNALKELCYNFGPNDNRRIPESKRKKLTGKVKLSEVSLMAAKLMSMNKLEVIAPIQATIRPIIPMDMSVYNNSGGGHDNSQCSIDKRDKHLVFPEPGDWFVRKLDDQVRIFNSLQQPRQIIMHCSNGRQASILCKAGDDLRKDSRCIEFLNLLNSVLRRDSQANARFLDIQTFLVLPLESTAGIIEMVPNCESLRNIVDVLYKEKKSNFVMHDVLPKKYRQDKPFLEQFENEVLPKVKPPVLPLWFLRKFTEPTSWYMAKLAFTRSCAVTSMGGYIIGLGDRHLDNILVDTCSGKLVHVDFNLLFHQGETLPTPERVPFRLTHNLIASFGPVGTEGNFRKICEIAMRVMRKEKEALITTLKPFMHDPCSEWIKIRDPGKSCNLKSDIHAENQSAKVRIEIIERKLKGFPRSRNFKPLTLIDSYSVEAQVENLIAEASDNQNLALMYYGWCPHI